MNRFRKNSTNFIQYKKNKSIFNDKNKLKTVLIYSLLGFSFLLFLTATVIYIKYIVPLPDVKNLENLNLARSSIIYDRS
jgi:hypothetical protein